MKKLFITLLILAGSAIQALAYDFQSGDLLYTISSTDPPCVSLVGHVDGTAAQGELIIPETVFHEGCSYTVSEIKAGAFSQCDGLSGSLVIPSSITKIGNGAFRYCHGFTGNLQIPNSVTTIEVEAFAACDGFTGQLIIPNSVVSLGVEGGSGGMQLLGSFQGCTGFCGLSLSNSASVIGEYCFAECFGLAGDVEIPEGVEEIGQYAFYGCENLDGVIFPNGLRIIGAYAFKNCTNLKHLVLPETIEEIYDNAFERCTALEEIDMQCLSIWPGWTVFSKCSGLSSLSLPEGMTKTGNFSFSECTGMESLALPSSLQEIEQGSFYGCTGLTGDLQIPDMVERIGASSFRKTGYSRVIFGDSLKYLSESAFVEMPYLQLLVLKAETPPFLELFNYQNYLIPRDMPVIVPCGSLEAYQNAEGWNEFTNMQEGLTDLLSVITSDESLGAVNILKEPSCEDRSVEVMASPNEGYEFLYWEANGERVSNENPYIFDLEEDTELVAFFSGTGINETVQEFVLYPNPVKNMIQIDGLEPSEVQVFNTLGQMVMTMQETNEINVSGLSKGIYLLRITDKEGNSYLERIIKE